MRRIIQQAGLIAVAALLPLLVAGAAWAQTERAPVRDRDHVFRKYVTSWKELHQQGIVMQKRDYSCGAAALATVARYYWGDNATEAVFLVILDQLLTPQEAADRVRNGLTMTDLRRAAVEAGYQASLGRLSFRQLSESKVPLIVGITVHEHDHFVVYRGTDGQYVYLADPLRGRVRVPIWEFMEQWQQNMVLAIARPNTPLPGFTPLSITRQEVEVGSTNQQYLRRNALQPPTSFPRP